MSSIIGNAITYQVFSSRLKREIRGAKKEDNKVKMTENKITYDRFIEDIGFKGNDFVRLGDFFLQLLSQYPHNIFERVYYKTFYFTREQAKLIINPKYLKEIKDNVIIHPSSLPMLCPPVE
jgi:hypothetical protein